LKELDDIKKKFGAINLETALADIAALQ